MWSFTRTGSVKLWFHWGLAFFSRILLQICGYRWWKASVRGPCADVNVYSTEQSVRGPCADVNVYSTEQSVRRPCADVNVYSTEQSVRRPCADVNVYSTEQSNDIVVPFSLQSWPPQEDQPGSSCLNQILESVSCHPWRRRPLRGPENRQDHFPHPKHRSH